MYKLEEQLKGFDPELIEKLKRALEAHPASELDATRMVSIGHDEWCDRLNNRGPCNCDVEVTVRRVRI